MATVRLQIRRGTASQWTSANPILAAGEMGVETDTRKVKIGDGTTGWTSLNYIAADNPEISEIAQDAIDAALVAGTGIVKSYNDGANTITVSVDTSVIATKAELAEVAQDSIDQALTAGTGITKNYNDAANTLTVSVDTDVISTKQYVDDEITNLGNNLNNTIGDYVPLSEKGTALGVATLDADTLVPLSQLTNATDYADNSALNAQVAAISAASDALDNHNSDQTNVHGIVDTAALVTLDGNQTLTSKSLTSPALTGTPTAPTADPSTNTTQIATTAFVSTAVNNLVDGAPGLLNTLNELAAAINDDESFASTVTGLISNTDNALTAHQNLTTNIHGINNTANLVYTDDIRLNNERTPVDDSVITQKIANNAVTTDKIANASITTAKIDVQAVTTEKIADDNVTTIKIADSNVTTAKLADSAVTEDKIGFAAVTNTKIATDAVTTEKILDDAITTDKLAVGSVTTTRLADSSVIDSKIADGAVSTSKLDNISVTTEKINNQAVTSDKLASDSVTTAKIADSNVTTDKIAAESVTTAKLADDAVTEIKILDGSITSAKIANATIVNADINSSAAIEQSKIANLTSDLALKAPLAGPTFTGTVVLPSTTSVGDVSSTELGYLDGVTSAIQTQIDSKLNSATAASTYAPIASPTFTGTVSGVSKSMVGLGNVDNTSDANKPVSTATQTALDAKLSLSGGTMTGALTLSGAPTQDAHAATKAYVDNVTAGINFHQPVRVATTGNITLSGTQTIDGVSVVAGDRVLVKDQTDQKTNGIYVVASGSWTRATDADNTPSGELAGGDFTLVLEGTPSFVCVPSVNTTPEAATVTVPVNVGFAVGALASN